jgi:hypothetical protein
VLARSGVDILIQGSKIFDPLYVIESCAPLTANQSLQSKQLDNGEKVKQSPQQAVEAHRIVRRRGSHIFQRVGSQLAVRLSKANPVIGP